MNREKQEEMNLSEKHYETLTALRRLQQFNNNNNNNIMFCAFPDI